MSGPTGAGSASEHPQDEPDVTGDTGVLGGVDEPNESLDEPEHAPSPDDADREPT